MSNEQMDSHLERITSENHEAARSRQERRNATASSMVVNSIKAEHDALQRRRRAVYKSAFHVTALISAGCLIWGLSEMSTGSPLAGLAICLAAVGFGMFGCIMDCLGGGR